VSAVAAPRRRRRTQARRLMWLQIVAALFVTLLFLGPIVWMVSTAFKATVEAFSTTPTWFFTPTLDNFSKVINGGSFLHPLLESFLAASVSTILALVLGTGIAYPLARYRLRGKQHLAFWILSLRIIPPIVTVVPVFLMVRSLGLAGSIWGLTILYTYINLPLTVWLNAYVTPVSILWTQIMAAGTLVAIPVWFAALVAQRYLVRGLTLGAVK
jgi:ABC-type glycerol-3-phosphate transport system permease component